MSLMQLFCSSAKKELISLFVIITVFLAVGGVLIATNSLSEDQAKDFHALLAGNMSLRSDARVIKRPTLDDNTFIYAINDVEEQASTSPRTTQGSSR